jgi:hypothetical protein
MLPESGQDLVPQTTRADEERAVVLGVKRDIAHGWTQVQDAGGSYERR